VLAGVPLLHLAQNLKLQVAVVVENLHLNVLPLVADLLFHRTSFV
jgi:hypothetical protein